jgi:hypothetical protein
VFAAIYCITSFKERIVRTDQSTCENDSHNYYMSSDKSYYENREGH